MSPKRKFKKIQKYFKEFPGKFTCTRLFLKSLKYTVKVVEKFGTVMLPVVYSMKGYIKILKDIYKKDPCKYEILEEMIMEEVQQNGSHKVRRALLWIMRYLDFISHILWRLIMEKVESNSDFNFKEIVDQAYVVTLAYYQKWMGKYLDCNSVNFPATINLLTILGGQQCTKGKYFKYIYNYWQNMSFCITKFGLFYQKNNIEQNLG